MYRTFRHAAAPAAIVLAVPCVTVAADESFDFGALQDLSAAATRAGTLAERHPDALGAPLETRS
jgi:hypothetical protein